MQLVHLMLKLNYGILKVENLFAILMQLQVQYQSISLNCSIPIVLVNAWSLAFSPDGQYIATGSFGGKVDLYRSETGQKEMTLDTQTKFVLSAIYVNKAPLLLFLLCVKGIKFIHRVLTESYLHAVHKMVS